jgi:4a-hydroxytetrahydrobiopterin dehydratase
MPSSTPLDPAEVTAALTELPGWSLVEGKLHKDYKFRNFGEAFGFMVRMALRSEQLDHHPEWSNVYNRVSVDLVTHSAEGITAKDIQWARTAEGL